MAIADIKKKNTSSARVKKQRIFLFTMLIVPILNFLVFYVYLNSSSILLAFRSRNGAWTIDNFQTFFESLKDGVVGIAIKNTAYYFLVGLILFPTGIIISCILFKKIIGYKFFRIVFYLPSIITTIVMVVLYKEFVKPWGPAGLLAEKLGAPFPLSGLLSQPETATRTIIGFVIWLGIPSGMLMWCGAMTRIPQDVFEAAKIDGCGTFRELRYIIVPLIWPTVSSMFILSLTGFLGAGGPILLFTDGANNTSTLSFWIFRQVYTDGGGGERFFGVVSAAGLFFTSVSLPVVLFVRWVLDKLPTAEY